MKTAFVYVDGSYNTKSNIYGYGFVMNIDDNLYEQTGKGVDHEKAKMRNVAGEILGAQKAIEFAINKGIECLTIYYDYQGIEMWAIGKWKTNKKYTQEYVKFINSVSDKIELIFVKVKAHSKDYMNDKADNLAKQAVGIV